METIISSFLGEAALKLHTKVLASVAIHPVFLVFILLFNNDDKMVIFILSTEINYLEIGPFFIIFVTSSSKAILIILGSGRARKTALPLSGGLAFNPNALIRLVLSKAFFQNTI